MLFDAIFFLIDKITSYLAIFTFLNATDFRSFVTFLKVVLSISALNCIFNLVCHALKKFRNWWRYYMLVAERQNVLHLLDIR